MIILKETICPLNRLLFLKKLNSFICWRLCSFKAVSRNLFCSLYPFCFRMKTSTNFKILAGFYKTLAILRSFESLTTPMLTDTALKLRSVGIYSPKDYFA